MLPRTPFYRFHFAVEYIDRRYVVRELGSRFRQVLILLF